MLGVLEWRAIGLQSTTPPARPSLRPDPHAPRSNRGLEDVIEVVIEFVIEVVIEIVIEVVIEVVIAAC